MSLRDRAPIRFRLAHPWPVDVVRFGVGATALTQPRALLQVAGSTDAMWARRVVRLLGARLMAQSVTGLVVRDRRILLGDAAVEVAHALTTVVFAASFPHYRALAVTSGAAALGFAAADLRAFAATNPGRRWA